jgi:hypothetical protein
MPTQLPKLSEMERVPLREAWSRNASELSRQSSSAAWMPRLRVKVKVLQLSLLAALFVAEKRDNSADGLNF